MPRKQSRGKAAARKPARQRRAPQRQGRKRRYLFFVGGCLLAAFAAYLLYLNYLIDSRFQGGAWALPSRVYSRALEIYPGLELTRELPTAWHDYVWEMLGDYAF